MSTKKIIMKLANRINKIINKKKIKFIFIISINTFLLNIYFCNINIFNHNSCSHSPFLIYEIFLILFNFKNTLFLFLNFYKISLKKY